MEKSKYLQVNRIEFLSTYHCPGRCKHCSVGNQLNRPGPHHVPVKESVEAVRWLAAHYPVQSMMTFGGEPLLYPEVICALHSSARDSGIPTRQLITNGYFSKRPERIKQVAEELVSAGVNDILLSVDAFHQERIPLEPVLEFARHIMRIAPEAIQLQPSWVVNQAHDNLWNARTKEVLAAFDHLGVPVGRGDDIFMAGNAVKNLAEYYPAPRLDLEERCGSQPYTEPLDRVTSLSIEPNGDVTACAFPIGNLLRESMEEIAAQYDPYTQSITRALLTGGARELIRVAEELGLTINCEKCYSICGLCRQIKDQIVPKETDVKV